MICKGLKAFIMFSLIGDLIGHEHYNGKLFVSKCKTPKIKSRKIVTEKFIYPQKLYPLELISDFMVISYAVALSCVNSQTT